MLQHRHVSGRKTVDFARTLKERLGKEEVKLAVTAGTVDVPRGHLAIIFTLTVPNTSMEQRLRVEHITKEECIKYLQETEKTGNSKFRAHSLVP